MKVSVIIPSYNSVNTIDKVFKGLLAQKEIELVEEIIVVDSSDDGLTKQRLNQLAFDKVRIVNIGTKVIPAESRNKGAELANGDFLIFLDADASPDKDWFKNFFRAYSLGVKAGGGGISLAYSQRNNLLAKTQYYLQFNEYIPKGSIRVKQFVPSCNMFCEKGLFMEIGGFPKIRASEDVLFGLNLSKRSKMFFVPNARVHHIFRQSFKEFFHNQIL
ncbi:MAG: glycosyltransferase family 2 protein, partial [Candidatus Omnitrophota bacterium]